MSFFAFCSFFYHTGVRKRGISIKNILQLMLPRSSRGHMPVPLKRMLLGRRICPLPINTLEQCKCALLFAELIHRQVSSTSGSHQRFNLHQGTCVCDMDTYVNQCWRLRPRFRSSASCRGSSRPPERGTPTWGLSIVGLHCGDILDLHCDARVAVD